MQLFQHGQAQPVMIIQCKGWDAYKVGVKPVRERFGVMAAEKVGNGVFFTTGEFTAEVEDWARDKNIDLVNGREFISRIGRVRQTLNPRSNALFVGQLNRTSVTTIAEHILRAVATIV